MFAKQYSRPVTKLLAAERTFACFEAETKTTLMGELCGSFHYEFDMIIFIGGVHLDCTRPAYDCMGRFLQRAAVLALQALY